MFQDYLKQPIEKGVDFARAGIKGRVSYIGPSPSSVKLYRATPLH